MKTDSIIEISDGLMENSRKSVDIEDTEEEVYIFSLNMLPLTHWGRVTPICVGKLTIVGSDNGLSPGRRQAIIWTNAGILLIRPLETNFNEM